MIGFLDHDDPRWFTGARLMAVLCNSREISGAFIASDLGGLTEIADFWDRYTTIGRCVIDPEHREVFVGDKNRWQVQGDFRRCLWCGGMTQRRRTELKVTRRVVWDSWHP